MSSAFIDYFYNETDLSGSLLLLAIAISRHAQSDGYAFPGVATLSKQLRLKERQTQYLIKRLESLGYVSIDRNESGRGRKISFFLKRVQSGASIRAVEKAVENFSKSDKGCILASRKGAFSRQERVHSRVCKEEKSLKKKRIKREKIKKESLLNFSEKEKEIKIRKKIPIPADFPLTDEMFNWATNELPGIDSIIRAHESTMEYLINKGPRLASDWLLSWREGMKRREGFEIRDRTIRRSGNGSVGRSTV